MSSEIIKIIHYRVSQYRKKLTSMKMAGAFRCTESALLLRKWFPQNNSESQNKKIGSNKCEEYLRSAVRTFHKILIFLPHNFTILCFKIKKCSLVYSAINLLHNSLRSALPSIIFCGEKQFSFFDFQFKNEKH